MMFYPEEVLIPWLALQLDRPIKWIEDRSENFVATTQERGQIHDAEIALTRDGRILGVKDSFLHDTGAYDPYGLTVPINSQCTLLGPYRVPAYESEFRAIFTNKTDRHPLPRRRPPAWRVRHRAADGPRRPRAGNRRHRDPPAQLPAPRRVPARPRDHLSGLRAALLRQRQLRAGARQDARHDRLGRLRPRRAAAPARRGQGGRHRRRLPTSRAPGIGPFEGARVQVQASGKVTVVTGIGTQGQGHFTVFAQVAAEQLGVDGALTSTWSPATATSSTGAPAPSPAAAPWWPATPSTRPRRACARKPSSWRPSISEPPRTRSSSRMAGLRSSGGTGALDLPRRARRAGQPDARRRQAGHRAGAGGHPLLRPPPRRHRQRRATPCILEVDPETMQVKILKYVVVHDCGVVINPLIVDGQVHGGVAQGIGNAFYEQLVFDDNGQLLNASLHGLPPPHRARRAADRGRPRGDGLAAQRRSAPRARAKPEPSPSAPSSPRRSRTPSPSPAWRSWRSP